MKNIRSTIGGYFNWDQICLHDDIRIRSNGIIFFSLIAVISLIMVIINAVTATMNLLVVTSLLFIMSAIFGVLTLNCNERQHIRIMGAACALILLMSGYFIYSGGTEGFSIIWLCVFPLVGYLVLYRNIARFFNIALLAMVVIGLITPVHKVLAYAYTPTFRFRFSVVMVFGSICAWLTEMVRSQTQKRLARITHSLKESARKDTLTGVGNRNAFREDIGAAHTSPLSYVLVDVDYFKAVNDTYGHDVGDIVLATLARLLADNVRPLDRVYRWGGEEFLITMPKIEKDGFEKALERLRKLVAEHTFQINKELSLKLTISMGGVVCCPDCSIDECVKMADECMYRAKQQGRNRVVTRVCGAGAG